MTKPLDTRYLQAIVVIASAILGALVSVAIASWPPAVVFPTAVLAALITLFPQRTADLTLRGLSLGTNKYVVRVIVLLLLSGLSISLAYKMHYVHLTFAIEYAAAAIVVALVAWFTRARKAGAIASAVQGVTTGIAVGAAVALLFVAGSIEGPWYISNPNASGGRTSIQIRATSFLPGTYRAVFAPDPTTDVVAYHQFSTRPLPRPLPRTLVWDATKKVCEGHNGFPLIEKIVGADKAYVGIYEQATDVTCALDPVPVTIILFDDRSGEVCGNIASVTKAYECESLVRP